MLNNILASLLPFAELVLSHRRFKNEIYYSFIALVSCYSRVKEWVKEWDIFHSYTACFVSLCPLWLKEWYINTHSLFKKINFTSLRTSPVKIRATWLHFSGYLTLVSGDITSHEMTFGQPDRLLNLACKAEIQSGGRGIYASDPLGPDPLIRL